MKINKAIITILLISVAQLIMACPVCDKQQPEITRGITHGVGPQSNWDWLIISVIVVITLLTLFYSLKFLIYPKERGEDHIKRSIFNNELR